MAKHPQANPWPTYFNSLRSGMPVGGLLLFMVIASAVVAVCTIEIGDKRDLVTAQPILMFERFFTASWPAVVYLVAAIGLGNAIWRWIRPSTGMTKPVGPADRAIAASLGLSLMLTFSQVAGCLGLLSGKVGIAVAWVPVVIGVGLLFTTRLAWRYAIHPAAPWLATPALIVAGGVLFATACAPPGWLWQSEFGGYDALSYHLTLPQEWITSGSIKPVQHNVYSYLPSYLEASFLHLAMLTNAPPHGWDATAVNAPWGLVAGNGWRLLSCQLLHAGMTLMAAWMVGVLVMRVLQRVGGGSLVHDRVAKASGWMAASVFLATPWTVVVGSLAYNEMGMAIFFAGALLVAIEGDLKPAWRAALAGWLVGAACGCKSTAMLFAGVPVGVVLAFAHGPVTRFIFSRALLAGAAAGTLALSPWLIRNVLAGGNPVFPFASGLFGAAHWSQEQIDRFAHAHHASIPLLDRLKLLVITDLTDPAGPTHRGFMHPQHGMFLPAFGVACAMLLILGRKQRAQSWIWGVAILLQLMAWLFTTHLQSRFLIPMHVTGLVLMALGFTIAFSRSQPDESPATSTTSGSLRWNLGVIMLALLSAIQAGYLIRVVGREREGQASLWLATGPAIFSGQLFREEWSKTRADVREQLAMGPTPEIHISWLLPHDAKTLLVGDATPLYISAPHVYATTWDDSPLTRLAKTDIPPERWNMELVRQGITHVMVNSLELQRLEQSGFLDPTINVALRPEVRRWFADLIPVAEWPGGRFLADIYSPLLPDEPGAPSVPGSSPGPVPQAPPSASPVGPGPSGNPNDLPPASTPR